MIKFTMGNLKSKLKMARKKEKFRRKELQKKTQRYR